MLCYVCFVNCMLGFNMKVEIICVVVFSVV